MFSNIFQPDNYHLVYERKRRSLPYSRQFYHYHGYAFTVERALPVPSFELHPSYIENERPLWPRPSSQILPTVHALFHRVSFERLVTIRILRYSNAHWPHSRPQSMIQWTIISKSSLFNCIIDRMKYSLLSWKSEYY